MILEIFIYIKTCKYFVLM